MITWDNFRKSAFYANADIIVFRWTLPSGDYETIRNIKASGNPILGSPYYLNPSVASFGISIINDIKKVIVTFGE